MRLVHLQPVCVRPGQFTGSAWLTQYLNPFTAELKTGRNPTARSIEPHEPPQLRGVMRIYTSCWHHLVSMFPGWRLIFGIEYTKISEAQSLSTGSCACMRKFYRQFSSFKSHKPHSLWGLVGLWSADDDEWTRLLKLKTLQTWRENHSKRCKQG